MPWVPPHYDREKRRVRTINNEPSLTKQEFKDVCDINQLIEKYKVTGELPQLTQDPLYGDFTEAPDYIDAVNILNIAQEQFEGLPSKVRNRFDNDPGEFLRYMENLSEDKRAELLDLELIDPAFQTELDMQVGKVDREMMELDSKTEPEE